MQVTRREFMVLLGAFGLSSTPALAGSEGLAVIVHPKLDVSRLSDLELEAIYLTERRFWSGNKPIIPFNLAARSEARVSFDGAVLRMDPDTVARYWRDRRVRSGSPPPRQAPDPLTVVRLVANLEGAIGYAPESLASREVRVVARVKDGKVQAP